MYKQGLLRNGKKSLIPKYFVIEAKQILLAMIQMDWFRPENNVLLMLIDNQFARIDAKGNIVAQKR